MAAVLGGQKTFVLMDTIVKTCIVGNHNTRLSANSIGCQAAKGHIFRRCRPSRASLAMKIGAITELGIQRSLPAWLHDRRCLKKAAEASIIGKLGKLHEGSDGWFGVTVVEYYTESDSEQ